MSYVKSGDIKLYPCSNRGGEYNPEARLGTEFNITKMNSAIASRKSFVIDYKVNDYIEFSISGYYFRIDNISTYLPNTEELYVNIKIGDKGDDSYHLPNLQSLISETDYELDYTDNTFVGLSLTDEPSSDCESLLLLKKDGDNWNVPLTSKLYKSGEDILPDTAGTQNIGSESLKFNKVHADSLHGTADKAKEFDTKKSIALTGDISGTASSTGVDGWTIENTTISNNAVTTDKINASAVTTDKLANDSVTEDKIASGTITDASINDEADINGSKIKDASIDGNKLMPNTISSEHLGDIITTSSSESNGISVSLTQNIEGVGGLNIALSCDQVDSAAAADKLSNNRTFSITGDVTATEESFDGTANVQLSTTVNQINGQPILGTKALEDTDYLDDGIFVSESSNQVKKASFAATAGSANVADNSYKIVINKNVSSINYDIIYLTGAYSYSNPKTMDGKDLNLITNKENNTYTLAYDRVRNAIYACNSYMNPGYPSSSAMTDFMPINIYGNATSVTNGYINIGDTTVMLGETITDISTPGTITANSFYATSDERLKENIVDYKYHNSILDLPVKQFNYKSDPTKTTIGCIAQELQAIYPELVETDKDGYLKIAENKLVYLLLEEVKQLKEEIKKLKEGN